MARKRKRNQKYDDGEITDQEENTYEEGRKRTVILFTDPCLFNSVSLGNSVSPVDYI